MCKRLMILFFCALLFCTKKVLAQQKKDYSFRHISQSDGLLHTMVNSIVQDSKGFIWILTPNGLQRYDGSRFVNYPYNVNNSGFLENTRDASLFADKKNNCLWIMNTGIEKLDLRNNTFTLHTAENLLKDSICTFSNFTDSAGHSITVSDFGLYKYNNTTNSLLTLHSSAPFLAPGRSNLFIADKKKEEAWICNWDGLTLYNNKTKAAYTHNYNPIRHPLLQVMDKKELKVMLIDGNENYWISTGSSVFYRYNALSKKLFTYSLAGITTAAAINREKGVLMVNCFFEDNHQDIWIGTSNGGLLHYNPNKDSFTGIISNETNERGLHYNYAILCIFQDKEENIWLGTDKGINIFNPYRQYFQSIHHKEDDPKSIPKNEIMNFIQAANGDIIAGTWGGGITVYDSKWNFKKNISFPGPYEYNLVWGFAQNDDGTVWIGCQHGFIHIYNPSNGVIRSIHPPELNSSTIWCMTKDGRGNIWMGLNDGKIAGWNKQQNKFYSYNDSAKGIPQEYKEVSNIFFDSRQRCWVSTKSGFKQFDTDKQLYTAVYVHDPQNKHSISANYTEGIEEYDDSTLLIGTQYGGLNFFNTGDKTFSHLTAENGLPANTIHAIKKDTEGYVWFTTDYNLYKFKPSDKKFIRLNIDPGIVNSEFTRVPFYPLQDGRWLTNTTTEMLCFYTKNNFAPKNTDAKIEITRFKVFDNDLSIDSLLDTDEPVKLTYQQNFLTIEFALLDFSNLQQTNFYYRLDEVDKDWVSTGAKNFASYTNLGPGEYTFHVKTENEGRNQKITSFKIIITPPFWKTTWFKLIIILLAAALIYFLFRKRVKAIRHEAELKQKVAETEMMALRAQMNPHFIFNCINSIDALIQSNDKYHATVYLNKFAKLIRNVLDSSKESNILFSNDMDTLQLYVDLEELRSENKFTTKIEVSEELLGSDYKVPPLIVQPFVENAIHHGLRNREDSNGKLNITVKRTEDAISYTIMDNGIGREAAKKLRNGAHQSYGMQMSIDRIKMFNNEESASVKIKDLYENKLAAGTEVQVTLKMK